MFEQPHEYVPLIVLAIVPAGRVWGVDAAIIRRWPAWMRWPLEHGTAKKGRCCL